jgi:nitric oxide reductase subunit C
MTKRLFLGLLFLSLLLAACGGDAEEEIAEEPAIEDPILVQGETIFKQDCASCHAATADTVIVGPSLAGIATTAGTRGVGQGAAEYIQLSILRPGEYVVEGFSNLMPSSFGTNLSGEELDALIAYLLTLE